MADESSAALDMVVKLQLGFFLMSARDSYLIVDLHATFSPQNFESSIKGEIDVSLVVALALHSRVLWGCFERKVTIFCLIDFDDKIEFIPR